jgi:N-acetylglucosamine-6-sulfatase
MVKRVRFGVRQSLLTCLAALALAGPAAAAQPNIVVVVTDDQRSDTLQYMPTVWSELIGRGVNFTNAFVTNPLCCPSRASILTGAYSHSTGVYTNELPDGGFELFRDDSTIATWLDGAGYETALVGKYLNGYSGSHVPPGWDRWVALAPPGYYRYGYDIDGRTVPITDQPTYSTDFLAQEALSFLAAAPRPFFLYLAPYAPHAAATPAERHASAFPNVPRWRPQSYNEEDVSDKPPWVRATPELGRAKRASIDGLRTRQLRSLLAVDEAIAALLQSLSESGELANTVFVLMSDNGLFWGEHRLTGKRYPYEESIRVPFVIRYDGLIDSPRSDPRLVLGIDLAPTLAELAGATASGSDGRSIVPLIQSGESEGRARFLVEGVAETPPTYCAVRTQRHLFVTYRKGHRELYDVLSDPWQLRNRARDAAQAGTVAHLRRVLARLCNPPPRGLSRRVLCTQVGTGGPDTLLGTPRYDILCGREGNDVLDGAGGPDYLFAGAGRDNVAARDGERDVISCGSGRDLALVDPSDRARPSCERVRTG